MGPIAGSKKRHKNLFEEETNMGIMAAPAKTLMVAAKAAVRT